MPLVVTSFVAGALLTSVSAHASEESVGEPTASSEIVPPESSISAPATAEELVPAVAWWEYYGYTLEEAAQIKALLTSDPDAVPAVEDRYQFYPGDLTFDERMAQIVSEQANAKAEAAERELIATVPWWEIYGFSFEQATQIKVLYTGDPAAVPVHEDHYRFLPVDITFEGVMEAIPREKALRAAEAEAEAAERELIATVPWWEIYGFSFEQATQIKVLYTGDPAAVPVHEDHYRFLPVDITFDEIMKQLAAEKGQ